jgi:hypothetical protein
MRYINALIDYSKYKRQQQVQQLFMKTPFDLSIIQADENKGCCKYLLISHRCICIEVSDFLEIKKIVSIPIHYDLLPQ